MKIICTFVCLLFVSSIISCLPPAGAVGLGPLWAGAGISVLVNKMCPGKMGEGLF